MAKKKEQTTLTPREALRKGWLAYIGMYGAAYDRANEILSGKATEMFEDFVAKGEEVEARAQDAVEGLRERAKDAYGDNINFDRFRNVMPSARKGRVEELEAEVEALTKKVATLTKKAGSKRSRKAAA